MAGTAASGVRGGDRPGLHHDGTALQQRSAAGAARPSFPLLRGIRYVTAYAGPKTQTDAAAVSEADGNEGPAGHAALGNSQASAWQTLSDRKPGRGKSAGSILTIRSPNAAVRPM